eukprot:scaffold25231_cov34-Prasinocladus_malaysianus.AAC.2
MIGATDAYRVIDTLYRQVRGLLSAMTASSANDSDLGSSKSVDEEPLPVACAAGALPTPVDAAPHHAAPLCCGQERHCQGPIVSSALANLKRKQNPGARCGLKTAEVLSSDDAEGWDVVNLADKNGRTALMVACSNDNVSLSEFLLRQKADPSAIDSNGRSVLLEALEKGRFMALPDNYLSPVLVHRFQCCPCVALYMRALRKWRCLESLNDAFTGSDEIVRLLLDNHATAQLPRGLAAQLLCNAVINGNAQRLQLLLEAGLDPAEKYFGNSTPLHLAAENGNIQAARCLLHTGEH